MKKYAIITIITVFFIIFNFPLVRANTSDIAISEVLFDPTGTDTGLEYIVIRNFGNTDVNMAGWDLYPDGVGYYTFPNFSLGTEKSVKILLRASGTNDDANLYDSMATGNMGNSSGSVALFSSTTHGKDTIVSFVRYQKSGSTEKKTWESTAASVGLWTAGTFANIDSAEEGQKIFLNDFSQKTNAQSWHLVSAENTSVLSRAQNTVTDININNAGAPSDLPSSAYFNPLPAEKMRAYAGKDMVILAGAEMNLVGYAEDLKGEPSEGARFLWNFGDGSIGEGKNVFHTYRFPGIYNVSMDSSVGANSASDMTKITVVESPLIISEIKPGDNGWLEIKNNSARMIDVSGFGIERTGARPFYFPAKTILSPWAETVFGSNILKFPILRESDIQLLYPNGSTLLQTAYKNSVIAEDESLNWAGSEWVIANATPGEKNNTQVKIPVVVLKDKNASSEINPVRSQTSNGVKTKAITKQMNVSQQNTYDAPAQKDFTASIADAPKQNMRSYFWLTIGAGGGILMGLIFLFIKRLIT